MGNRQFQMPVCLSMLLISYLGIKNKEKVKIAGLIDFFRPLFFRWIELGEPELNNGYIFIN